MKENNEYDDNKAGVCWITFKEGVAVNKIQDLITDFYIQNESVILGMTFEQITNFKFMKEGHKAFTKAIK